VAQNLGLRVFHLGSPSLRRSNSPLLIDHAWRTAKRLYQADAVVYAGYLAFLTALVFVPALAVAFWLSEQSAIASMADRALREYLTSNLFPDSAQSAIKSLTKLRVNARKLGLSALLAVGLDVVLKAYALNGAMVRITAAPVAWWHAIRVLLVLLVVFPIAVAAVVWVLGFLHHFTVALIPSVRIALDWLFIPLKVSLPMWAGLIVIYAGVLPRHYRMRSIAITSAVVMLAIEAMRLILTGYFSQLAQVRSLYGAFSAVPIVLTSLFLMWLLVLCGAGWLAQTQGREKKRI
jgi:membrane protein